MLEMGGRIGDENAEAEFVKQEEELDQDIKERDEFVDRLKQRDQDRTKQASVEDRSSMADSEAQRRRNLADNIEARNEVLPDLRERSTSTVPVEAT